MELERHQLSGSLMLSRSRKVGSQTRRRSASAAGGPLGELGLYCGALSLLSSQDCLLGRRTTASGQTGI